MAFDSLFCPEGSVFVHNDCSEGRGFCSLPVVSRGDGLDEIDTCIIELRVASLSQPSNFEPELGIPASLMRTRKQEILNFKEITSLLYCKLNLHKAHECIIHYSQIQNP